MLSQPPGELYAAALAGPPFDPQLAPCREYFEGGRLRLRVPTDEAALHDLIRTAHRRVGVSRGGGDGGGGSYERAMRAELARLLDAEPVFWSRLWPAGLALGKALLARPALVRGRAVLELGCGLGPGALCAALAGAARVVATDIEPKALALVEQSARDNRLPALATAVWDWNRPPPPAARGPFGAVLAGDVIYQDAHAPRLGELLAGPLVAPGGLVLFSDSTERPYGAGHASLLCDRLAAAGFERLEDAVLDVSAELAGAAGVAAGRHVRLLVYAKPGRAGGSRAG